MNLKIVPNFFSIVLGLIVAGALFKQFNTQELTFEKPALAVVYIITLIICIGFMVKKSE